MIKERNGHYELPYFYAGEVQNLSMIIAIKQYLIDKKALSFVLFNQNINDIFFEQKKLPVLHSKHLQRELVVSNELKNSISSDTIIQDGDGDCAFT